MSSFFFNGQNIIEIKSNQFDMLKHAAMNAPLKRARFCLHHNPSDQVHEMIIAFCRESYIRPHRHFNKSESFHVIEGKLLVIIFNDNGHVTRRIEMGTINSGYTFLYRLSSSLWHMVVPLSEFVIIHETTAGPFIKEESDFAPWSPDENDIGGIKTFIKKVMQFKQA